MQRIGNGKKKNGRKSRGVPLVTRKLKNADSSVHARSKNGQPRETLIVLTTSRTALPQIRTHLVLVMREQNYATVTITGYGHKLIVRRHVRERVRLRNITNRRRVKHRMPVPFVLTHTPTAKREKPKVNATRIGTPGITVKKRVKRGGVRALDLALTNLMMITGTLAVPVFGMFGISQYKVCCRTGVWTKGTVTFKTGRATMVQGKTLSNQVNITKMNGSKN